MKMSYSKTEYMAVEREQWGIPLPITVGYKEDIQLLDRILTTEANIKPGINCRISKFFSKYGYTIPIAEKLNVPSQKNVDG